MLGGTSSCHLQLHLLLRHRRLPTHRPQPLQLRSPSLLHRRLLLLLLLPAPVLASSTHRLRPVLLLLQLRVGVHMLQMRLRLYMQLLLLLLLLQRVSEWPRAQLPRATLLGRVVRTASCTAVALRYLNSSKAC